MEFGDFYMRVDEKWAGGQIAAGNRRPVTYADQGYRTWKLRKNGHDERPKVRKAIFFLLRFDKGLR